MKTTILIRSGSSTQSIEKFGLDRFLVKVKSLAKDNEANIELLTLLLKYFGVPAGYIKIKHGVIQKL